VDLATEAEMRTEPDMTFNECANVVALPASMLAAVFWLADIRLRGRVARQETARVRKTDADSPC
jgi:hypothetical protein